MKLNSKVYEKGIKVYSDGELESDLVKKVINYLKIEDLSKFSKAKLVKASQGRWVFKLEVNGESYYAKKYFYRRISKKLKNLFRSAEALRALKISHQLLTAEIPVVQPVLAAVYRRNLWTFDSIFVTRDFGGTDLQDFLAYGDYDKELKEEVIKKVAQLWADFHKEEFLNGDPNLASILVKFVKDDIEIGLVDVDNVHKSSFLSWKKIMRTLIDFNAHTYSGLDKMGGKKLSCADRVLFLKEFLKRYGKKVDMQKTINHIAQGTIEELIDWGKEDLVNGDEGLNAFL